MPWNDYASVFASGLAANLPTSPDIPSLPRQYFATDTGFTYTWNPAAIAWSADGSASGFAVVAAAGHTQGNATAISPLKRRVIISALATATQNGLVLPTPVTNMEVQIINGVAAGGVKIYPALHNFIQAGASNAADTTNLAAGKSNTYIAVSASKWMVQRGA